MAYITSEDWYCPYHAIIKNKALIAVTENWKGWIPILILNLRLCVYGLCLFDPLIHIFKKISSHNLPHEHHLWPLHPPSHCCLHAVVRFDCSALLFVMNWVLPLYARPLSLIWHVGGSPAYQKQHKINI